jgi:hypothetical protein
VAGVFCGWQGGLRGLHMAVGLTVQVGYTAAVMCLGGGGRVRVCVCAFV